MTEMSGHLEQLAREMRKTEAELKALAFETGMRELWRQRTLDRFLRGEISRDEAVREAGIDWVELSERQRDAISQDMAWAKGK